MKKHFLRIILALFLVFSFTVNANAVVAVRGATTITGGASGSLDSFDGATLNDGDICFVFYGTSFYFYKLNATSGAVESSPTTISPDTNAGNKRWILQNTAISGYTADTFSETTPAAGVTVDGLKIKDSGFALGSDADGDTYHRAAGALARLAKGAADLKMFMNAGATAPEWANGLAVISTTRDIAAADGNLAITGAGFKPSACILIAVVNDTSLFSLGVRAGSAARSVFSKHAVVAGNWAGTTSLGFLIAGAADYSVIAHVSFDSDGSTISFTKTGSPTGTANLYMLYLR